MIKSEDEFVDLLVGIYDIDPGDAMDFIGYREDIEYPMTNDRAEQLAEEALDWLGLDMNESTLNEGWTSTSDWRNVADVQDALKFSEISSDYEFVKNFGNFFCYKRKSDGRPTVAYYLIRSFGPGRGFGYKDMSAQYSGRYNAGAANWLKQALLDYGSTPKNPGEFEECWKWIEEGKHEQEQRADYKNTLKKGDKVNFGNVIVTYDRPYNNQSFVGYAEDEPYKPYKWYYRKIVDLVKENMQLKEAKQLLKENGYILNESNGWDLEAAGIEGLDEVMEQTDSLLYELRNCVRGAYTEAENWAELGEYIKNLAADWENIGEVMIELNDELPTEDDE